MILNKKIFTTTVAALLVFGALATNKAQAQDPESVSFTVTQAVTVSGHQLAPGRYTVRPSRGNSALIITRAADEKFVTFALPVSNNAGSGDAPAVKLVEKNGAAAVSSVYFPDYGREYFFNVAAK